MAANLLNANYWKKAYLIEFRINDVVTDAFTFSVPPQQEEFVFPQRKSETKTFGGAVVADYGNDMVQINLSGTTINQELKLIFKSRLGVEEMTGEQEIFYLRDLLKKYGQRDNLQGKSVYLYALNGGNKVKRNPKWWRIFVGQLEVTRSKDKPFCYDYKFSATGAPEVTPKSNYQRKLTAIGSTIDSWKSKVDAVCNAMNEVADQFEDLGAGFLTELSGYIGTLRQCITSFTNACGRYADIVNGIISGTGDVAIDAVMLGDKVLYTAFRYYPTITAEVYNNCVALGDVCTDIYDYCDKLSEFSASDEMSSAWQSVKELFDENTSNNDITDVYSRLAYFEKCKSNELIAETSKNLDDIGIAVIPGDADTDDEIIITYGYKVVSITDAETSWDQIAQDYYGNSSLSYILATYNNLPADKPLKSGQSILIPKLNLAESKASENEVYNTPDVKDNYGKDLIIENSDFAVHNGDLKLIGGVDNLQQSLLNRYSTMIGARIRNEVYGIQASIGDAVSATSALIQASVHQTTVEDPRVETVEEINFEGNGDELAVAVVYIDKNGEKRNFGGTI